MKLAWHFMDEGGGTHPDDGCLEPLVERNRVVVNFPATVGFDKKGNEHEHEPSPDVYWDATVEFEGLVVRVRCADVIHTYPLSGVHSVTERRARIHRDGKPRWAL